MASIGKNSEKQYSSCLKLWWRYCLKYQLNPYSYSVDWILKFLTELFEKGSSYGTLNCTRSALALILSSELGSNEKIKRFFKGVQNLRPTAPRYDYIWDPSIVLNYLCTFFPNEELSLKDLSCKLITLLALITAHRAQTFSLIKLNNIHKKETGFEIWIKDRIKTSRVNKIKPILYIPYFHNNPSICAAQTLEAYLHKTSNLRGNQQELFLTFKRPHKPVSTQTLSRWIKMTLKSSGINIEIFSAHSCRHAATSSANNKGINIDIIRSTAGWSKGSETFAKFYNRPVVDKNVFATSILS